jgi:hypothetical protein
VDENERDEHEHKNLTQKPKQVDEKGEKELG